MSILVGDILVPVEYVAIGGYIIFCLTTLCISCLFFKEKTAMNLLKHAPNINADDYDPSAFNADININMNEAIKLAKSNDDDEDDRMPACTSPPSKSYAQSGDKTKLLRHMTSQVHLFVEEEEEEEKNTSKRSIYFNYISIKVNKLLLYLPIFTHFWDMATDLAVLCDWIAYSNWHSPAAPLSPNGDNINTFYFIIGSIFFQLLYRAVSGYRYAVQFSICGGILQFLDVMLFFETYSSINSKKGKSTLQLRWIRKMESVLESAPQAFLQLVYVLQLNAHTNESIPLVVKISLLFSVFSITSSVVRSDEWKIREETNANVMCPPNWRFVVRSLFRLLEITTRLFIMALLSQMHILVVAAICFVEIVFYLIMYRDGLLGNDLGNVAEILIVHPNLSLRCSVNESSLIGAVCRCLCCWNVIRLLLSSSSNIVSIHFIHRFLESALELSVLVVYEYTTKSNTAEDVIVIMFVTALFGMFCVPFLYLISYRWFIVGGDGLEMNVFGFLHHAHCEDDMTQFMRYVYRVKWCVNEINKVQRTPLMEAVLLGNYNVCKLLCSMTKYIDLSATDGAPHYKQIIHYVAECGDDRLMQLILNAMNKQKKTLHLIDAVYGEHGKNALLVSSQMGAAQCIQLLLQNGANVNHQDEMGRTALHYAIFGATNKENEQSEEYALIIAQILSFEPDLTLCDTKRKWNPLLQAIGGGSISIVDLLISPSVFDVTDMKGDSALHVAVRYNQSHVLQYLLQSKKWPSQSNWNAQLARKNEEEKETPLQLAISCCNTQCFACLCEYESKSQLRLALLKSVKKNRCEMVQILIRQFNCDPNFEDKNQMTPLRWAVFKGYCAITKELLCGGARDDLDQFGQNIVFYAATNNHAPILKLLSKAKADFCIVNNEGQTATDKTSQEDTIQFIKNVRNIQLQNKK
eukprot:274579_1